MLYDLVGTAEPPLTNGKIYVDLKTRTTHTELLRVTNWLQITQRFKVVVDPINSEKFISSYNLPGNKYIIVPGNDERNYKFIIQVYKECNLSFKVNVFSFVCYIRCIIANYYRGDLIKILVPNVTTH